MVRLGVTVGVSDGASVSIGELAGLAGVGVSVDAKVTAGGSVCVSGGSGVSGTAVSGSVGSCATVGTINAGVGVPEQAAHTKTIIRATK